MKIFKTFNSSLWATAGHVSTGVRKLVGHSVVIGDYPTLTFEQVDKIVREYLKNPEPNVTYQIWDEANKTNHIYEV